MVTKTVIIRSCYMDYNASEPRGAMTEKRQGKGLSNLGTHVEKTQELEICFHSR